MFSEWGLSLLISVVSLSHWDRSLHTLFNNFIIIFVVISFSFAFICHISAIWDLTLFLGVVIRFTMYILLSLSNPEYSFLTYLQALYIQLFPFFLNIQLLNHSACVGHFNRANFNHLYTFLSPLFSFWLQFLLILPQQALIYTDVFSIKL